MFKLVWYIIFLPFYMLTWGIKIYVLIFKAIIKAVIELCEYSKKKERVENWNRVDEIVKDLDYKSNENIIDIPKAKEYKKESTIVSSGYELVRPEEKEYKKVADNIENIYKELGYNVRVVNIEKNRYNTSYEIIFSENETSQYELLSKSDVIKSKFTIDGVDIKPEKKISNRIIIYIPLEFKNVEILSNEEEIIDPLLNDSIEFCIQVGYATASLVQRRFKIGYARAGRIIDQMEAREIISGYMGNKPREILMDLETWKRIKNRTLT